MTMSTPSEVELPRVESVAAATPDGPLAHVPIFQALEPHEQQALFSSMHVERFGPNETIFWLGDPGGTFYVVNSGEVAITVPNEQGEHVTLEVMSAGGFFGEISLLDGGTRTATARTLHATEVYALARDSFQTFLRRRPDVAIRILEVMGRRQRESTRALRGLRNPNAVFEATYSGLWERASEFISNMAANKYFVLGHVFWFGGWIAVNLMAVTGMLPYLMAFDPYPFGLLTLVVSLEAIFLSIFVMVSQNRQSQKDRVRTDLDYQVNVKAHLEIMALGEKIDRLAASLAERPAPPGDAKRP